MRNIKLIFNLTLVMMGGKYTLVMTGGGGGKSAPPPIFICKNNSKSNKIMHCVEKNL